MPSFSLGPQSEIFDASFDQKSGAVGSGLVTQLHSLLQRCLLRRLKSDVEKGLPPKTETKIFLPLSPMQTEWYRKVLMRDLRALTGDSKAAAGMTTVQNIVMHLRKVCNHPYLFDGAEPGPPFVEGEHIVHNSGKLAVLDKLLKRLKEGGHRVLIFVTMTRMLDILQVSLASPCFAMLRHASPGFARLRHASTPPRDPGPNP